MTQLAREHPVPAFIVWLALGYHLSPKRYGSSGESEGSPQTTTKLED